MTLTAARPWRALRAAYAYRHEQRVLGRWRGRPRDRPSLWIINHYFDNEIKVLGTSNHFARWQLFTVPPSFFNRNLLYFPPAVWKAQVPYEGAALAAARSSSRRHAQRLWDAIEAEGAPEAIITPSDIFYWLRAFLREGQQRGVPCFVFDKEGTISPASFQRHAKKIRHEFPPVADRFYVWSERQQRFWVKAGCPAKRIRVVGSLRTDLYRNMPPPTRRAVLVFGMDPEAYLTTVRAFVDGELEDDWRPLKNDVYEVLRRVATRHPDVSFTFKFHPQQRDIKAMRARVESWGLPNTATRTGSRGVDELVKDHSWVVGFQTTALMEAALAGRPTIYCGWGTVHEAVKDQIVPLHRSGFGVHRPGSPGALEVLLERLLDGQELRPPSTRRLEMFFHRPDGEAARRHAEALVEDLAELAAGPREPRAPVKARATRRPSSAVST